MRLRYNEVGLSYFLTNPRTKETLHVLLASKSKITNYTGAKLRHNDFQIRKTERQRKDVSNLFNRFMIYKGQTCAFII